MNSIPPSQTEHKPDTNNLLVVNADEEGQRLERFLKKILPSTPHSLLHKWLRSGQVRLNGARVKANATLEGGDAVRLPPFCRLEKAKSQPTNDYCHASEYEKIKNLIIKNTEDYMIIAKPAGMACQGGSGVYHSLDYMLSNAATNNNLAQDLGAPRLVHRLDRPTSGLLLVAKHRSAAADLSKLFRRMCVRKIYCAILAKEPQTNYAKYTSSLARAHDEQSKQAAETQLSLLDRCGLALVLLRPLSGRKHQLRRHMADAGTPILGETLYITREERKKTPLMLHAMRLEIRTDGLEKKYQRYALRQHLPPPAGFLNACEENFLDASKLADSSYDPFPV